MCSVHEGVIEKAVSLVSCKNQVHILILILKSCATLGMLLNLPQPHLDGRCKVIERMEWEDK